MQIPVNRIVAIVVVAALAVVFVIGFRHADRQDAVQLARVAPFAQSAPA
jgi:hypothetical protein